MKKIAEKMVGCSGAESKVSLCLKKKKAILIFFNLKAVCTEAGMFALRERRIHVTQEDFEMAVAKIMKKDLDKNMALTKLWK